ncbi:hypothetical protein F750_3305 [Streptomyces sp. PAMC 26508]|nr:hypothetical protein F750_3305 [Streptomyces sp. PAMC 26508]
MTALPRPPGRLLAGDPVGPGRSSFRVTSDQRNGGRAML